MLHYRPEIDGLRALAVLPVVLFHAGFDLFSGGYIGVDVFFVISGYLITGILVSELARDRFSIARFYERRARRILPALVLVMAACIPFAWLLMLPRDFQDFAESVLAASLFSSNVLFWLESGYFDTAIELKPLIHTWSLGIEEQFYICYPILLFLGWRYAKRYLGVVILLTAAVSLAFAEDFSDRHPNANFYFLPTRGWELLLGAYLAYREFVVGDRADAGRTGAIMSVVGLLAILSAVFVFDEDTAHPGLITLLPVLGTALIIRYGHARGPANSLLTRRAIVGLGLISYSLYLWHQPVFVFARYYTLDDPSHATMAALALLSLGLALVSYRFIESPFRNQDVTSRRTIWTFSAGATAALVMFGSVGIALSGLPSRFPPAQLDIVEKRHRLGIGFLFADGEPCSNRSIASSCIMGDSSAEPQPSWALVGDSHAAMLAPSLDADLAARGLSGIHLTYAGCAYALELVRNSSAPDRCLDWNRSVRDYLLASDIENILIGGRYVLYFHGTGFDNGEGGAEVGEDGWYEPTYPVTESERRALVLRAYADSIAELLDAGKNVYLVYPVPPIGWDVPRYWFKRARLGIDDSISVNADLYYRESREVIETFDSLGEQDNLVRIYPDHLLCNTVLPGRCATELRGEILYDDDDHLNRAGSDLVVRDVLNAAIR